MFDKFYLHIMILRILLGVLVGYIFYKLLVDLIIPVVRTTRQVHRQFSDIHDKMQEQANQFQQQQQQPRSAEPSKAVGDYIDYEEVK